MAASIAHAAKAVSPTPAAAGNPLSMDGHNGASFADTMRIIDRILLASRIVRWRLTWSRRDLDYRPPGRPRCAFHDGARGGAPRPDGACCLSTGMAGNARCSTLFWAIRENFEAEGRPHDLTWIAVGGQGGRGRAPGTVEEVGLEGLVTRFISGHVETTRSLLALAEAGKLELHVMPAGRDVFRAGSPGRGRRHGAQQDRRRHGARSRAAAGARRSRPGLPRTSSSAAGDQLRFRFRRSTSQ
jgi:propionate CoA-transferase